MFTNQTDRIVVQPANGIATRWPALDISARRVAIASLLLVSFVFAEPFFFHIERVLRIDYFQRSIHGQLIFNPAALFAVLLGAAYLIASRKLGWKTSRMGKAYRRVVLTAVIVLSWTFTTYSYNFYYGQWHTADRVILALLTVGAVIHPNFLPLFSASMMLVASQFHEPLQYSWTDKIPVVQTVFLASFAQLLRPIFPGLGTAVCFQAIVLLWCSFYFVTGLAKLQLPWLLENPSGNILFGAYVQNGWLANIGPEVIGTICRFLTDYGFATRVFVTVVELGFPIFLIRRNAFVAVLGSAILLHSGIFLLSGILFWKWVAVDLVMLGTAVCFTKHVSSSLFNIRTASIGLLGVLSYVGLSQRDVWLAWLDSPYGYAFRMAAIDDSGTEWALPPSRFAPYDLPMAQGRLYFLTHTPQMVDCLGAVTTPEKLVILQSLADHRFGQQWGADQRRMHGRTRYDEQRRAKFLMFLKRFIAEHNTDRARHFWFSPPQHIWTFTSRYSTKRPIPNGHEMRAIRIDLDEFLLRDSMMARCFSEHVLTAEFPEDQ